MDVISNADAADPLAAGVSTPERSRRAVAVVVVPSPGADGHHPARVGLAGVLLALALEVDALVVIATVAVHSALVVAALDGGAQGDLVGLALADRVPGDRVDGADRAGATRRRVARVGLLHAPKRRKILLLRVQENTESRSLRNLAN